MNEENQPRVSLHSIDSSQFPRSKQTHFPEHQEPGSAGLGYPETGSWSFEDSVAQARSFALETLAQEVSQKQLFYHNFNHIKDVERRANQILFAVAPDLDCVVGIEGKESLESNYFDRTKLLLELCAAAHDMVQVFPEGIPVGQPRLRNPGVSERATSNRLLQFIYQLNQQHSSQNYPRSAQFSDADILAIRDAIDATVCIYDPVEQSIYQPGLYDEGRSLSLVARILALADLGTLGIDGINAYNQEGALLFLEENLDVVPLLVGDDLKQLRVADPVIVENLRQRLLQRSRFQVNFARSRFARLEHELRGFPAATIPVLTNQVFQHLTSTTIHQIESTTPTDNEVTLETLLQFFQFKQALEDIHFLNSVS